MKINKKKRENTLIEHVHIENPVESKYEEFERGNSPNHTEQSDTSFAIHIIRKKSKYFFGLFSSITNHIIINCIFFQLSLHFKKK